MSERHLVHIRWPDDRPSDVRVSVYPSSERDLRTVAEETMRTCADHGHIVMAGAATWPLVGEASAAVGEGAS